MGRAWQQMKGVTHQHSDIYPSRLIDYFCDLLVFIIPLKSTGIWPWGQWYYWCGFSRLAFWPSPVWFLCTLTKVSHGSFQAPTLEYISSHSIFRDYGKDLGGHMPQSQTEHWDFSPQELPVPVKQFLKLSGFLSISVIFGPSSYAYGDSSCVTIDM